jgi:hypothetical protein
VKPWILVGGGGALAIVGAILLPIGVGNVNSADAVCGPSRNCGSNTSAAGQGNAGRSETGAGSALVSVGAAALIGGLVWQFAFNKPGPTPTSPTTGRVWLAPTAGRGASGIVAGASF